ncbi:high mobility group protein B1 [Nematostella vectensis]|uniref:high mobility group protein B1 n=1 Tax=Nematostella vectensis TaxID=45351 RepID=UPI0020778D99|nr:high mobility group protein B1 [Nematostella vectensis]
MSAKSAKTPKISQFFSPSSKNGEMDGVSKKKRVAEPIKSRSPAKKQKKEKVPRKKKAKGDGPVVKRASSAYIHFTSDFRAKLKAKSAKSGTPLPKANEVAKLAGEEWKKLNDEQKKPYVAKAEADKQRYLKEAGKNDPKKDPDKPKRPPTAYFLFLAAFRKEMAGKALEDGKKIPSLAGERWREMSDEDKKPYTIQEAEERNKYEKVMEEWRKKEKAAPKPEKKPAKKPAKPVSEDEEDDEEEEEEEEEDDEEDDDDYDDDDDE